MKYDDTRVRFTKAALKEALLSILRDKPIAKVTVKEICDQAHINRGTFYLHYGEPNDLLKEIEQDFIREKMSFFDPYMKNDSPEQLAKMFAAILRNRDLSLILFGKNGAPQFTARLKNLVRESVLDDWQREFPQYRRNDLAFVFEFVFPGATNLILNWLSDSDQLGIEELTHRLDVLGHYCHMAVREFTS